VHELRECYDVNPLEYVARGWSIFPCHSVNGDRCTCGKYPCGNGNGNAGKHPRTLHGVKDATVDPITVQRWQEMYGHDVNWAVATGAVSEIVVVDVDARTGGIESLATWTGENHVAAPTLTAITGGGGFHHFFKYPHDGVVLANRTGFLQGVDFKSDGGYVILAPGRHVSGGQYAWRDGNVEIAQAPDPLIELVRSGAQASVQIDTANITRIPMGERNDTLFRIACRLRRQTGDDRMAVVSAVMGYNTLCDQPLTEDELRKLVDSAFRQDHSEETDDALFAFLADSAGVRNLTDDGNAHRLIDYHGADIRYVSTWGWMRWGGRTWQGDSEGLSVQDRARMVHLDIKREVDAVGDQTLKDALRKWSTKTESAGNISAMMKLAKSDTRVLRAHEAFDTQRNLVSCRNGVLDLDTGVLRDHSPDDYITRCTNVDYDPDARLAEWDAFVQHACDEDDELVRYVQRAAGYSLSGSVEEECFFIIVGPAASGKSTFISGMQAALGDYAGSMASDTILLRGQQGRRESDLAGVVGKRFMSVVEMPEGERLDESVVKQLTGGDAVAARFLYKNPFTFQPQFKLWIATNHEPRINDDAIWRRIKRIPFPRGLESSQRDPRVKTLISNPEIGGRAVLAWAVKGYQMYKADRMVEPARVTRETAAYHMRQDRIGQFIEEAATVTGEASHRVGMTDLYLRYTTWCSITGERTFSMSSFATRLEGRQGITSVRLDGQHWVRGLRLRSSNPQEQDRPGGTGWGL
jgi:putative DNA primase/helicase